MLNRRLARIKAFQAIYAFRQDPGSSLKSYDSFLKRSIDHIADEYHKIICFAPDFLHFINLEWEREHEKHFLVDPAIAKLKVFKDNIFLKELSELPYVVKQNRSFNWADQQEHFSNLLKEFATTEAYENYLEKGIQTWASDKKFWISIMHYCCAGSELFNHCLEEDFMNWFDDDEAVETAVLKALDRCKQGQYETIEVDKSLDEEHTGFSHELFEKSIAVAEEANELINQKTKNWEAERIALVDLILLQMAVAEFIHFPSIPVKVTINEYLEVAKKYSTPKSNAFLNGILDGLQNDLKDKGKIKKIGRGLVG